MQTNENNPPLSEENATGKRTEFFEKREMNNEVTDKDNAGDETFTPIYLNDDNVLQTPDEKKHDETVNVRDNDTLEATDIDASGTTFDKMNDDAKNGTGE